MATGDGLRNRLQGFRPDTRNLLVAGVVVAVVTFVLGFGLTALNYMRGGAPSDVVTVPDVRQMLVEDASRALDRSDLAIEVGDSFPNPTSPRGAVLAQSPLPGQEVSPGTGVRVIISRGQAAPAVPDVSALPLALATQTLQATGFSVVIEDAPGEGQTGDVVGTIPRAGTSVHLPATVRLRVGAPALPVMVPVLVGMQEFDARDAAENLGLNVEVSYFEGDGLAPDGFVIAQEPQGGDELPVGSSLQLRVRGRAPFEAPDQEREERESQRPQDDDDGGSTIQEGRDS